MDSRSKLLTISKAFHSKDERAPATIGNQICSNNALFSNLESGKGCTIDTFDRAMLWFSANWPAGLAWPSSVERPRAAASEKVA